MDQTSRAINSAPRGAIFVCEGYDPRATEELCKSLSRWDLRVHTPAIFDDGGVRVRGLTVPIVVDPCCRLSESQKAVYALVTREAAPQHQTEWSP